MTEKKGWKCPHCINVIDKLPEGKWVECPKCEITVPRSHWKPWPPDQEEMDGSPAHVKREHIDIQFQLGPRGEVGINGCCIREVIQVAIDRLEGFQKGEFKCRENALAITKLQEAQHWLHSRTDERIARGVKGYNKV